jgi:hypothetical protein
MVGSPSTLVADTFARRLQSGVHRGKRDFPPFVPRCDEKNRKKARAVGTRAPTPLRLTRLVPWTWTGSQLAPWFACAIASRGSRATSSAGTRGGGRGYRVRGTAHRFRRREDIEGEHRPCARTVRGSARSCAWVAWALAPEIEPAVRPAIAVEVPHRHGLRPAPDVVVHGGLEGAVAVAQQHAHGITVEEGCDQVLPAVAVEVSHRHGLRSVPDVVVQGGLEGAVSRRKPRGCNPWASCATRDIRQDQPDCASVMTRLPSR